MTAQTTQNGMVGELRHAALTALTEADVDAKLALTQALSALRPDPKAIFPEPQNLPGRPAAPILVEPRQVPQRSLATAEGHAALLHSIAHIEFNAINLALDAVWRFADMPEAFYTDWAQVAAEEAYHFDLVRGRLCELGFAYGDFPAHDGLWQLAQKTRHSLLARMGLVPRLMEARGLDVNPPIQNKLASIGDRASVAVLEIILRDEVGHVAIGNRWFYALCEQVGEEPQQAFERLLAEHNAPRPRGPFNLEARRRAGFSDAEMSTFRAP